jgi:hypothetical protein
MTDEHDPYERNRRESTLWYCLITQHLAQKYQRKTRTGDDSPGNCFPRPAGVIQEDNKSSWPQNKCKDNQHMPNALSNNIIAFGTVVLGFVGLGGLCLTYHSNETNTFAPSDRRVS